MNQRSSSVIEATASFSDGANITAIDPWGVVLKIASSGDVGLRQCLQWLSIFVCSAVDIPGAVFKHFKSLTDRFRFSITEIYPLIRVTFLCVWMRSLGRQDLIGMISSVHLRLAADVSKCLNEGEVLSTM